MGGSVVDGGGGNNMVEGSVVDLGNSGVVVLGDHRFDNSRLHNRLDKRGVDSGEDSMVVGGDRGNMAVGANSRDVAVGAEMEGLSLSLSLPLDNVLDRSILGNVLGAISTGGDSSVLCRVVVVGDGVGGNLRLSIDHRGSNTLDNRGGNILNNRGGKRGGNIAVGGGEGLDSSSVIELVDGRVDLGHSSNMAVGADSREVVVGADKEGISLSLSLPLNNVLDRSILGYVFGANNSIGDSSIVLWVIIVGDSVGGNLGLGIHYRSNMLYNRSGNRLEHRGGKVVIGGGKWLDSSVIGVCVEGPEERGGGVHESIGFRLSTGNNRQSENYKHLHDEELLF